MQMRNPYDGYLYEYERVHYRGFVMSRSIEGKKKKETLYFDLTDHEHFNGNDSNAHLILGFNEPNLMYMVYSPQHYPGYLVEANLDTKKAKQITRFLSPPQYASSRDNKLYLLFKNYYTYSLSCVCLETYLESEVGSVPRTSNQPNFKSITDLIIEQSKNRPV